MRVQDISQSKKGIIDFVRKSENVLVIFDMDGVLASYSFGEANEIIAGSSEVYRKKRPILTTIGFLEQVVALENSEVMILSSCYSNNQIKAKEDWLEKNMAGPKQVIFKCVLCENFTDRLGKKVSYIKQELLSKYNYIVLIEDTHSTLRLVWELDKKRIIPVHVVNIID
jgi:hypothetical protein